MEQPKSATLKDVINYTPETYFSDDEITLVRNSFNGPQGVRLLKVIRKIFVPSISDPELPIEEMGKDFFMAAIDFKTLLADEVKPAVMGVQLAMKAVMGGFIQLKQIANIKEETAEERASRLAKNSTK